MLLCLSVVLLLLPCLSASLERLFIHQPPEEDARMLLSFVKRAREGEINLGKNQTPPHGPGYQYHPLLHLEITSKFTVHEVSYYLVIILFFPAEIQSTQQSTTESSSVAGAVVGGIVGVLFILIAAILIALVVILLVRRRQGSTQLIKRTTNPTCRLNGK